jgi:ribonucleoside-diphosphate reductase alpha chain
MVQGKGLSIPPVFVPAGEDPYDMFEWETRDSRITKMDGTVVFEMTGVEVPAHWSQTATDVVVSKYFRKAGVRQADGESYGPERSARQVVGRLAATWRWWGEEYGYFATPEDAHQFENEIAYMLLAQIAAPNSPQWFNTGLHLYGIEGPAQGHYSVDPATATLTRSSDAYSHPQTSACFIQPIDDNLVNEGGIMDLWTRESRIFKYGSGTGTNFSTLRGK